MPPSSYNSHPQHSGLPTLAKPSVDETDAVSTLFLATGRTVSALRAAPARRFLKTRNATTPTTASEPTMVPTAMPAMAPVVRPAAGCELVAGATGLLVVSGAANSSDVTLKQGMAVLKRLVSTYCWRGRISRVWIQDGVYVSTSLIRQYLQCRRRHKRSGRCHCSRPGTWTGT